MDASLAGTTCQACGISACTRYVELYQNIGLLVVRFRKSIKGYLCRSCIDAYFWEFTLITLGFGWWGIISFFTCLFAIPANLVAFLCTRGMAPVPQGSVAQVRVAHAPRVFVLLGAIVFISVIAYLAFGATESAQRKHVNSQTAVVSTTAFQ
jgi:hypothetical protein